MIGSDTLIVKNKDGSMDVHICSVALGVGTNVWDYTKLFNEFKKMAEKWANKPDAKNISQKTFNEILHSDNCISPKEPRYSQFTGDGIFYLDLISDILFSRSCEKGKIGTFVKYFS